MQGTARQQGDALKEALEARGRALGSAQARRLAASLLALAEHGRLTADLPQDDAEGPHLYNMGPSNYEEAKKTA